MGDEMVARRPGGPRRIAHLLVAALLASTLAAPAAAAPDPTAPGPAAQGMAGQGLGPRMPAAPSAAGMLALHRAVEDVAGPPSGDRPTTGSLAATGTSESYHDFCDDAPAPGDDLRRAVITRFPSAGTMRLDVATCGVVAGDALLGGVSLVLGTADERSYLVTVRQTLGSFLGSVVETSDDDPPGVIRHTGTGWLADGGHGVSYEFPLAALDDPDAFLFRLEARDAAAMVVDTMPEADETGIGVWPGSCERRDVFRAIVQAQPGRLEQALRSALGAGLVTAAVNSVTATFDVTLAGAEQAQRLAGLPGIATVAPSEVYEAASAAGTAAEGGTGTTAWWRSEVDAGAARDRASGAGVTIGIVDNGVDGTRVEFGGRVRRGRDVVRSRRLEPGDNSDRGGHGTLVAGVAAADSTVVAGIAPGATIRPYQVFDFAGCASANAIAAAIDAAIADDVDVLNLSLGSPGRTPTILGDALDRARQAGMLVVAAAGNDALVDQPSVPAEHPAALAVGATGPAGALASYSNRAAWVELAAPGGAGPTPTTGIVSLGEHDGYGVVNGTSFAAPIVAGAAALHLEVTGAAAATVRADLVATARDLGPPGRDRDFGFGMLDVAALLERAAATVPGTVRDIASACSDAPRRRFDDVPAIDVHASGVDCIAHYSVAGGFPDGSYRPGADVERGQMATFIANTILSSGGALPPPAEAFGDVAGTAHAAAIGRLAAAGIVSGVQADAYHPGAPVTRAQMATFLVRALEYRTGTPLTEGTGGFADTAGSAHEATIAKAAAAGLTGGATRDSYRPGARVTRGQMGSFLARALAYLVDTGAAPAR